MTVTISDFWELCRTKKLPPTPTPSGHFWIAQGNKSFQDKTYCHAKSLQMHCWLWGPDVLTGTPTLLTVWEQEYSRRQSSVADADNILYSRNQEAQLHCCNSSDLHRDQRELCSKALSWKANHWLPAEMWSSTSPVYAWSYSSVLIALLYCLQKTISA